MGLRMDDIHNPTVVPSGPTSQQLANGSRFEGMSLRELISEKDGIEEELKALGGVLESHGVNMNTSLTTFDGYPRDDLDIAQIRTTRARIIRLRNDYNDMMKKIEVGLHDHHAALQSKAVEESKQIRTESTHPLPQTGSTVIETPFAKVNSVVDGSPAHAAGLKPGDGIRSFGDINWMNHENLSKVAEVVQRHEGRTVIVKVQRKEGQTVHDLTLQLSPRRGWGGRGLLGCHLLPA